MAPNIVNPFRHGKEPDQVTGQSATTNSTTQITVSWDAVTASPAVTSYVVEWSANGSSGWAEISESPTASTSLADASLSVYTPYYYRVKAINPLGSGDYSANTSATTNGVVPSQITGLTATFSSPNINLAWNAGSGGTPDSYTYTVQRSTSSGSGFSDIVSSHGSNSYTNSSPSADQYYYQVKAVNDYGSGAYSSEATATVPSPPDALLWGGDGGSDMIQYITVANTGSAADFGDITSGNRVSCAGLGGGSKGYCVGGDGFPLDIRYVTIATTSDSSDYGDCETGVNSVAAAASNSYGMILGGYATGGDGGSQNMTQRFTIGTSGSASEYSDMTDTYNNGVSALRKSSIFIIGWGAMASGPGRDEMQYGSFTSSADASTYGDCSVGGRNAGACSNGTRGFMFGGEGVLSNMDTMTIGTPSDSTDFGDLLYSNRYGRGATNATRAVCMGGGNTSKMEECQYWTIGSTGSCSDFGDLDTDTSLAASSSIAF